MLTSAQLTQLATELSTDPVSLGYAALISPGAGASSKDQEIADVLNLPRGTVGGVNHEQFKDSIPVPDVFEAIVPSALVALTQLQISRLTLILTATGGTINAQGANVRGMLVGTDGLFTAASATGTALAALAKRNGSRAEKLFGFGIRVDHLDVAKALRPE